MTSRSGQDPSRDLSGAVLEVRDLSISYETRASRIIINDEIDLTVHAGESIAIVGESGSGKSLTARALLDLLPPGLNAEGSATLAGRPIDEMTSREKRSLRGTEVAMVMQDPFTMLNPLERVGATVTAALRTSTGRRLSAGRRRAEAIRRLAEVGIRDASVVDKYPFELSGGMRQRVGIAAAIAEEPRVLIADEPTTALDVTTQREILDLLQRMRDTHRLGLILITHDLGVAFSVCDRVHVMYAGRIVEEARTDEVRETPAHPYTANLLRAEPPLHYRAESLAGIPGSVPKPGERPPGCAFAARCDWSIAECRDRRPELIPITPTNHKVRCIRTEAILGEVRERRSIPTREGAEGAVVLSTHPVIETVGLGRTFGTKIAVQGASITVRAGESVGLVGESGSGKTTLGRMLVGLTRPTSGTIQVAGVDLRVAASRKELEPVRNAVQMAFQDPSSTLNPMRSIGHALHDALRLTSTKDLDRRTAELLELVGLPASYAKRRPARLSGGERQRVAIARALAREPKVVVCDEVVSALDVSVQAHILSLLRRLQAERGIGYVFISHDLAVVRQITERVYVLESGEIVEEGPTGRVLDDPQHPYTKRLIASIPDPERAMSGATV